MSNVKKPSVKFSLIENALDSIDLGLEYFYEAKKYSPLESTNNVLLICFMALS